MPLSSDRHLKKKTTTFSFSSSFSYSQIIHNFCFTLESTQQKKKQIAKIIFPLTPEDKQQIFNFFFFHFTQSIRFRVQKLKISKKKREEIRHVP